MGPFLQARRWSREAPQGERLLAGIVALLAAALLAWAVLPAGGDSGQLLSTAGSGTVTTLAGGVAMPADAGSASGSPTADGVSSPGAGGATPSGDGSVAFGPSGGSPSPAPAGDVGGEGDQPNSPAVARTDSDRGVTAEQIKVGFSVLDLGGAQNAGFGIPTLRNDIDDVIRALVADVNANGGIHGRSIDPVIKYVDILSATDQRSKCLSFVRDDQVFAVVDAVAFGFTQTRGCVSKEYETPFVTSRMGSDDEIEAHAPFHVGMNATDNQMVKDWVAAASAEGFFDPANGFKKLGIFSHSCDRSVNDELAEHLRQVGVETVSEFVADCDASSQQRSAPSALLQHRRDGVTHVFFGVSSLAVNGYLQAAEAQGYRPEYFASDYHALSANNIVTNFNAAQWDRVRASTETREAELVIGKPLSPRAQSCSDRIAAAGLAPVTDYAVDAEALIFCQNIDLFVDVARRAPVNLTRSDWTVAVPTVGDFDPATVGAARFEPGALAGGGRAYAIVEWRRECKCYHQIRDFRPSER